MTPDRESQAALFDFIQQWREDRARGCTRDLAEYLRRFPDQPKAVAREYLRLESEEGFADSMEPPAPLPAEKDTKKTADSSDRTMKAPAGGTARYSVLGEIARGGMGRIFRARDEKLHRNLAMKVALRRGRLAVSRFEEEAEITGMLDHPGVVPVHDTGTDEHGRSFFTMKLVEGRDLREIIDLVHREADGWNVARALEVLLKVCDTMAFAHSRGVVHRDLKPSNVRVGNFGEVYVIDWGLAKASGRPDRHDLRLRSTTPSDARRAAEEDSPAHDSPVITLEGDVIGTPCSMSPEQAMGYVGEVGSRSDVYSVGAMLYEVLCGQMPYVRGNERIVPSQVLARVVAGPPEPLISLCPDAPPELVAICNKAMAREPDQRYADMREMAADLRAHLEQRVVQAYGGGRFAELRKWFLRNKGLSLALCSALVIGIGALVTITLVQQQHRHRLQLLADSRAPADLFARFRNLCPSVPDRAAEMDRWLNEAGDLVSRRDSYQSEFRELRARALPWNPDSAKEREARAEQQQRVAYARRLQEFYRGEEARMRKNGGASKEGESMEFVQNQLASIGEVLQKLGNHQPSRLTWSFVSQENQFRHDALEQYLPDLDRFVDRKDEDGLITLMQHRRDFAVRAVADTLNVPKQLWDEAISSIANKAECPAYRGLVIRPQLGLIPLRRDTHSDLWEFLNRESGDPPAIGPEGEYRLTPETGIVLVLIPGGEFEMGAQSGDSGAPNYDPLADPQESSHIAGASPTVHAMLAPFMISKYEMTQAQWKRCAGRNPSECTAIETPERVHSEMNPVESVDWNASMQLTRELGLTLPTEAQWECAARGGTSTPWWTGSNEDDLRGAAKIATPAASSQGQASREGAPTALMLRPVHIPIGTLRANGFGLHDTCGNVSEWCRDTGNTSYDTIAAVALLDTFERHIWGHGVRVARGGSFNQPAAFARSSAREFLGPESVSPETGLRPSREIEQ